MHVFMPPFYAFIQHMVYSLNPGATTPRQLCYIASIFCILRVDVSLLSSFPFSLTSIYISWTFSPLACIFSCVMGRLSRQCAFIVLFIFLNPILSSQALFRLSSTSSFSFLNLLHHCFHHMLHYLNRPTKICNSVKCATNVLNKYEWLAIDLVC